MADLALSVSQGMITAVIINVFENKRYVKALIANGGSLAPEARLPLCCFAGVVLPAGLFMFAWTTQPSVHWIVPVIASFPFGMSMVLVFLTMVRFSLDLRRELQTHLASTTVLLPHRRILRLRCISTRGKRCTPIPSRVSPNSFASSF